ncbi:nitroreductase family protein [Chloroflexota bacterium]
MLDIIKSRRSIRRFQDKPIPPEAIQELLEAAQWAPSGSNNQPWVFVVVQEPDTLQKIKMFSPGLGGDPVALLIMCGDQSIKGSTAIMDVSMATQNVMLAANEIGLGSCCIRSHNQGALQLFLKLPSHIVPELTISLGYPAESPKPLSRRPIEETIHWEEYGGRSNEQ